LSAVPPSLLAHADEVVSFACGHDVMLDQPQELAGALIAAA
jgi:hypothetical protein